MPQTKLNRSRILKAARGLSYAEITRAAEEAVKEMLLRDIKSLTTPMLVKCLTERRLFLNH